MQRRRDAAALNEGFSVMVSARALISLDPILRSFAHEGIKPQRVVWIWRMGGALGSSRGVRSRTARTGWGGDVVGGRQLLPHDLLRPERPHQVGVGLRTRKAPTHARKLYEVSTAVNSVRNNSTELLSSLSAVRVVSWRSVGVRVGRTRPMRPRCREPSNLVRGVPSRRRALPGRRGAWCGRTPAAEPGNAPGAQ